MKSPFHQPKPKAWLTHKAKTSNYSLSPSILFVLLDWNSHKGSMCCRAVVLSGHTTTGGWRSSYAIARVMIGHTWGVRVMMAQGPSVYVRREPMVVIPSTLI